MGNQDNMFGSIFQNEDYLRKLAQAAAGSQYDVAKNTSVMNSDLSKEPAPDGFWTKALASGLQKMTSNVTDGIMNGDEKTPKELKTSAIENFTDGKGALTRTAETAPDTIDYSEVLRNANTTQLAGITPGYLSESVNINKEETAAMMDKSDQFAEGSLLGSKVVKDKNAAFDAVSRGLGTNYTTEGIHKTNRDDPHMESGLKSLGKDTDWMAILQTLAKVASA